MANNQAPSLLPDKRAAIDAFRKKLAGQVAAVVPGQRARLIVTIDATQSREHCWDMACQIQAKMFQEVEKIGALDIQLVFYRGNEFEAFDWISDARSLADRMAKIDCRSGFTQIEKVLHHAGRENARRKVQALVFIGDAMEEQHDVLCAAAAMLGFPVFVFQEADDPIATRTFKQIAAVSKGAHCRFNAGAAQELAELLRAVARYAAGGLKALSASQSAGAVKLLEQLK